MSLCGVAARRADSSWSAGVTQGPVATTSSGVVLDRRSGLDIPARVVPVRMKCRAWELARNLYVIQVLMAEAVIGMRTVSV